MNEQELKQYLLGLLSETNQAQLDLEILTDNENYERLLVAEDELIEAYLAAELTAQEKVQFERVFLAHPERQEQLNITRALKARQQSTSTSGSGKVAVAPSWWEQVRQFFLPTKGAIGIGQLVSAGTVLLVLTIGIRLYLIRPEPQAIVATSPYPTIPAPSATRVGTQTRSFELSPGNTMAIGNKVDEVQLTSEVGFVNLVLWLNKDQFKTYRVTLLPYGGVEREIQGEFARKTSAKGASFIEVVIPATELAAQSYILKVTGINEQGERIRADHFSFKVNRN